jgi:hypothetical protein
LKNNRRIGEIFSSVALFVLTPLPEIAQTLIQVPFGVYSRPDFEEGYSFLAIEI